MVDAILAFKRKEEDDFYALLGCDELSNIEQINAEYKIRAKALHPDKNNETEATKKFACLQRAKQVLTDPTTRTQYDKWRRCGMAISFDDWMAKKDLVHMSMHWAGQKAKQPMLEESNRKFQPKKFNLKPNRFKKINVIMLRLVIDFDLIKFNYFLMFVAVKN